MAKRPPQPNVPDAREHVGDAKLEAGGRVTREVVLQAYADTFGGQNGQMVLDDLTAAFHERVSESVNAEAASIDHPFRAYYIEGQRSVIFALRALVNEALMGGGEMTDE